MKKKNVDCNAKECRFRSEIAASECAVVLSVLLVRSDSRVSSDLLLKL